MRSVGLLAAFPTVLAIPCTVIAQSPLHPSTGPYPVGTSRVTLVDSARAELSHADSAEPRRLIVQVWYPAAPAPGTPLAPYIPEFADLAEDLSEAFPSLRLGDLKTRAFWDAAPVGGRRFPLVVFSHGMNSARFFYTGLVQDLASHGFVVAAVDHPFWTIAASFPDGSRLAFSEGMAVRDQLSSEQIDALMQDGVRSMAEDQAFVASRLPFAAPHLGSIIDRQRTGVMGHSMGGMAATQACWTYRIFSACASLDGFVWAREGLATIGEPPNRVAKPFLLLAAPQFLPPDVATLSRRYRRAYRKPSLCLVPGSRHNSASDLPQLRGISPSQGELDPAVAAAAIRHAVVVFFRSALVDLQPIPSLPIDSLIRPLAGDSTLRCRLTGS